MVVLSFLILGKGNCYVAFDQYMNGYIIYSFFFFFFFLRKVRDDYINWKCVLGLHDSLQEA